MSDRDRPMNLADALRSLPLAAPARSAWPQIAQQLAREIEAQRGSARADATSSATDVSAHPRGATANANRLARRRRIARFVLPAVLAAGVAFAFVATRSRLAPAPRPTTLATVAPSAASGADDAVKTTNMSDATISTMATSPAQLAALQTRSQALERWLDDTRGAAAPLAGQDLAAAAEIEDMIGLVDVQLAATPSAHEEPLWRRRVALLEDLTALRYASYSLAETGVAAKAAPATWTL